MLILFSSTIYLNPKKWLVVIEICTESKIYSHVEASTSRGGNSGENLDVDKKEKRSSDIDMDVSCNPRSWRNRFVYFQ